MSADAIDAFLKHGGLITRVQSTVPVTEQEIMDFLASVGRRVKYQPGDAKPYAQESRRYSIEGLVRLANEYRMREKLPPFALRPSP